jgi:hypothetical protein
VGCGTEDDEREIDETNPVPAVERTRNRRNEPRRDLRQKQNPTNEPRLAVPEIQNRTTEPKAMSACCPAAENAASMRLDETKPGSRVHALSPPSDEDRDLENRTHHPHHSAGAGKASSTDDLCPSSRLPSLNSFVKMEETAGPAIFERV